MGSKFEELTKYKIIVKMGEISCSQYEWSDGSSFDYLLERLSNDDPDEERGSCVAIQFNVRLVLFVRKEVNT